VSLKGQSCAPKITSCIPSRLGPSAGNISCNITSQLYLAFKPTDKTARNDTIQRIEACLKDIVGWMNQNFFKLNTDKTELIAFNPKRKLSPASNLSIQVGDSCIKPSLKVRNIGAIFNTHLDMEHHVNAVSRTCYTQIRNISKIR